MPRLQVKQALKPAIKILHADGAGQPVLSRKMSQITGNMATSRRVQVASCHVLHRLLPVRKFHFRTEPAMENPLFSQTVALHDFVQNSPAASLVVGEVGQQATMSQTQMGEELPQDAKSVAADGTRAAAQRRNEEALLQLAGKVVDSGVDQQLND